MNICFFCPEVKFSSDPEASGSGAATGGMERASAILSKELRRRGHSVEFYIFGSLPNKRPPRYIPFVSALLRYFFPSFFSLYGRSESVRFREFLREHKIDVVVFHKSGSVRGIPFSLKNLPCKLVTILHNTPALTPSPETYIDHVIEKLKLRSRLGQRLVRSKPCRSTILKHYTFVHDIPFAYALRYSDKFVLLSESFIPEFSPAKKFPERVCAISNIAPLAVENVDFTAKTRELLWLGRMAFQQKRPDYMLHIWQRLQDRFPDWKLHFVGEGPYLPELKTLAKELGVKNVSFEGFQDPAPYYRSAPIFCMTSTYEGFGLTLVEAQAYGCVPVAFESYSAVHDIIEDGVNGYLISPFDLDAYAEKLAQLMQDSELRTQLARNAQKNVAKFSSEAIGDKWEKLLKEISC